MELPFIGPDEAVRILDDAEKVMSLQLSAGLEWKDDIYDVHLKLIMAKLLYMNYSH